MTALLDVLLAAAVLVAAVATLLAPRASAGVLLFLVLGLLLVLVWSRLGAPDVALAEAAIASGVTGALLVSAITGRRSPAPRGRRWAAPSALVPVAAAAAAGTLLGGVLVRARRDGAGHGRLGELARDADGVVSHPVTTVLLDLRALDTLLEVAVLAAAVLSALALHRGGTLAPVRRPDTRPVLRGSVQVAVPLVLLLAGWFLVAGSSRPGGAFQAGALLAGAALLLALTGRHRLVPTGRWSRPAVVVGLGGFLVLAAATRLLAGGWFVLAPPWGATVVLVLEAVLVLAIGAGLATLVLAAWSDRPRGADPAAPGAADLRGADQGVPR